jgi:molybdate transport system substrate-binding protein
MRHGFSIVLACLLALAVPARAETLQVIAAGSLTAAFSDLLRRFPAAPDDIAPPEFGPSGLMREKIEAGAAADIFASADMDHARRLTVGHPERSVIHFTRNQLCALARTTAGLTEANLLERLLDPKLRLATSTPGADPGGDYAWAVFDRAEAIHPGAKAVLAAKALTLVGGGAKTPPLVPGKGAIEGVFIADRADVMLGYCSSAQEAARAVPGLEVVTLPNALAVGPAYGMVLLDSKPVTLRFAVFVMSEAGQSVLRSYGFDPTAYIAPAESFHGVLVQRAGSAARLLSPEELVRLPITTQRVALSSSHGQQESDWSGPLLWAVLVKTGAVDPDKPARQVRQTVRVTGADGYSAVFALAELAPEFAARPIQLADHRDGKPLDGRALRLIVPGEHRGGRSVRDVIRIDVD